MRNAMLAMILASSAMPSSCLDADARTNSTDALQREPATTLTAQRTEELRQMGKE